MDWACARATHSRARFIVAREERARATRARTPRPAHPRGSRDRDGPPYACPGSSESATMLERTYDVRRFGRSPMLSECLNCGVEFDGASQARFHSNACRVAYSRRKVEQTSGEPEHSVRVEREPAQEPAEVALPVEKLISLAREGKLVLTEAQEQEIRDRFGYSASERRTLIERDGAAGRILEKTSRLEVDEALWSGTPADRQRASVLVEAWGLEAFRGSAVHLMLIREREAQLRLARYREQFVAWQKKKDAA
jgi:hypothetical protein